MPRNFSFIIAGVLAGMERPGTYEKLRADFEFLKNHRISAIVSLTESGLDRVFLEEFGFRYLHMPVADFTAPSAEQIDQFLKFQRGAEADGLATLVHCGAGLGRTGTMLACALVARGVPADEAIGRVRAQRPYSIETVEQEDAVRRYAEIIQQRAKGSIFSGPSPQNPSGPSKPQDPETKNGPKLS